MSRIRSVAVHAVLAACLLTPLALPAQILDSQTVAGMRWRTVGPANFMGRVSDVQGIPGPSKTLFVAAAGGGIWKSSNNGLTWRPVFDDKRVISMGMLAIAASDTMQVWAGTGEPNSRNTIEPGGGVFKSTDGGITWKPMGLEKTQHIGRIVVNPFDANTVWVAALGAAWTASPDRGLYKTTDGGQTWTRAKFVSDRAGFVDVALDPRNPNTVWAASWERIRTPYSLTSGGPGSALWHSTDGGATWSEVKGNGWPEGIKGRIGLAIAPSNPDVMYAMVEAAAPQKGGGFTPARNPEGNGLYRSSDAGKTWTKMNSINTRPFYYSQVRVDPRNPDRVYFSSTEMQVSDDGGKTSRNAAQGVHVDDHALWIDPNDPERYVIGDDGGIAITFDRGGNFIQPMNLPISQFYEVSYDFAVPYNICGGAQDNGAWCGPSRRRSGQSNNAYWFTISGGDGFYTAQDPTDPNIVYGESQGGGASRVNLKTGERMGFRKPTWQAGYRAWEDSIAVIRGNPLVAPTREQAAAIARLRARQKQDSTDLSLRFNWNSPFFISPHNPAVIYFGGNRVLKSTRRGEDFYLISPDLSKNLRAQIDTADTWTGGVTIDATGAETYGTVVTLAESYVKPGILYAGTDDGNVWMTHTDGATWDNLTGRFPGLPDNQVYVTRVEPSHFDTLTFYVAFDNHRRNDFKPYLYVTRDNGKTFASLANNLPADGPADFLHVVREDPQNKDLLFVGSSLSVYASLDAGKSWTKFAAGLPSVPVYDLKIHPRDHDLIAATHGRGFWIVNVAALEQLNTTVLAAGTYLFAPPTAYQWGEGPTLMASGNGNAQAFFGVSNPAYGAELMYRLTTRADSVRFLVSNAAGDTLATLNGPGTPGLHSVSWNFAMRAPAAAPAPQSPSERRDSILRYVRGPVVLDSLARAKYDSAALARARQLLFPPETPAGGRGAIGGRGGGGGGGGRGNAANCERPLTQWDPFCARPAEAAAGRGGGGGGGRGGGPEPASVTRIFEIIGIPIPSGRGGFAGGGFGGRGGGGGTAGTGDYLITMTVDGKSYRQVLHVERVSGDGSAGSPFGGEEEHQ
jgi:photosystem II stability/assembly factor-like uncharacterized protein